MKNAQLFAVAIALAACTAATAQQFQFAGFQDVETAFASQQAKVAQLEAQLAAFQDVVADPTQAPIDVGASCCDTCCCSSWVADAELLLFKFFESDGVSQSQAGTNGSFDYELAPRLTLGSNRAMDTKSDCGTSSMITTVRSSHTLIHTTSISNSPRTSV